MEEYVRVRRLRFVEGLSLRAIARETGFHRETIKKVLAEGAPGGYRRRFSSLMRMLRQRTR